MELSQVTPKTLQDYISLKVKTLAPETVRKHHANIHKFLDYAYRLELIKGNPADKLELPDSSPLLPDYVSRHYRKVIEQNGFPFVQLRNLRDSAATLLHKKGYDAKSIQPLFGHAEASTTANIYIHSNEDDLFALADTLESSLSKKSNVG